MNTTHLVRIAAMLLVLTRPLPVWSDWETHLLPRGFQTASSFEEARALAEKSGRPLIVYYTRTNCPPCTLVQRLLRQDMVGNVYRDSYVFTAMWGSSMGFTQRESLRALYGVRSAPTWIVFRSNGSYVCTARGVFSTEAEAAGLHRAIEGILNSTAEELSSSATVLRACV